MSATIEIQEDLFCEMISSLLDKVDTKEQVEWLKKYGANFYDLKLYKFVESKHGVSSGFFSEITAKFWNDAVQYKHITWEALKEIITTDFYGKHLGLGLIANKPLPILLLLWKNMVVIKQNVIILPHF